MNVLPLDDFDFLKKHKKIKRAIRILCFDSTDKHKRSAIKNIAESIDKWGLLLARKSCYWYLEREHLSSSNIGLVLNNKMAERIKLDTTEEMLLEIYIKGLPLTKPLAFLKAFATGLNISMAQVIPCPEIAPVKVFLSVLKSLADEQMGLIRDYVKKAEVHSPNIEPRSPLRVTANSRYYGSDPK